MLKYFLFALLALTGCTISNHGVFPKPVWYWSADAKEQRRLDAERKEYDANKQGELNHRGTETQRNKN